MNKILKKPMITVVIFIVLLCIAQVLLLADRYLTAYPIYISGMIYIFSSILYISLFVGWTIGMYHRIMNRHVRVHLLMIGSLIVFWLMIRTVKFSAFQFLTLADRLSWYAYYIPMVLIPLFFFFTTLYMGEKEDYRINPKWYLLLIPAIASILLVMTNDLHGLVFMDFDLTVHAYGKSYSYGPGYYFIVIVIWAILAMSIFILRKKFNASTQTKKASRLPTLILLLIPLYTALHILKPTYGIGYYLDVSTFASAITVAFLETTIWTRLIHSNQRHRDFFTMSDLKAKILDDGGNTVYTSQHAAPLSKAHFEALKKEKTMVYDNHTNLNLSPLKGGYVLWYSDVSEVRAMMDNLMTLNEELNKTIEHLSIENEQRREVARQEKLSDLHRIMENEVIPQSNKMKQEMMKGDLASLDEIQGILFETSMTSTYIKRKVNLILTEQTEKNISTDEMARCFLESFQLLRYVDKACAIRIVSEYEMTLDMAMVSYDLYQYIIEKNHYDFDTLYVTYDLQEDYMIFAIQVAGGITVQISEFEPFKLKELKGTLHVIDEGDSHHISLKIPKPV